MNIKKRFVGAFFSLNNEYIPYVIDYSQSIFSTLPRVLHTLYGNQKDSQIPATIHQMMWKALVAQYPIETRHNSNNYVDQTRGLVDIYLNNSYTIFIWKWPEDDLKSLILNTINTFCLNNENKIHFCVYLLDQKTETNNHIVWKQETFYINGKGEKIDD